MKNKITHIEYQIPCDLFFGQSANVYFYIRSTVFNWFPSLEHFFARSTIIHIFSSSLGDFKFFTHTLLNSCAIAKDEQKWIINVHIFDIYTDKKKTVDFQFKYEILIKTNGVAGINHLRNTHEKVCQRPLSIHLKKYHFELGW